MNGKLEQPFLVKSGKIVKPLQNFQRAAVESRRRNENPVTAALNRNRAAKLADILFGNLRFSVAFHLEKNFILKIERVGCLDGAVDAVVVRAARNLACFHAISKLGKVLVENVCGKNLKMLAA